MLVLVLLVLVVLVVLVLLVLLVLVVVGKRITTSTNYKTYVVVLIPGVSVAILMILGLQ